MMRKAEDQAAFYRLLVKLLWYLGSGKSHVGYLCNCPRNPFVAKLVSMPIAIADDSHERYMIVLSYLLHLKFHPIRIVTLWNQTWRWMMRMGIADWRREWRS